MKARRFGVLILCSVALGCGDSGSDPNGTEGPSGADVTADGDDESDTAASSDAEPDTAAQEDTASSDEDATTAPGDATTAPGDVPFVGPDVPMPEEDVVDEGNSLVIGDDACCLSVSGDRAVWSEGGDIWIGLFSLDLCFLTKTY